MKTEIGPCPKCGHHALVKEKVDGMPVLNCWVCAYKITVTEDEPEVNPDEQDIFDDPDFYTSFPG